VRPHLEGEERGRVLRGLAGGALGAPAALRPPPPTPQYRSSRALQASLFTQESLLRGWFSARGAGRAGDRAAQGSLGLLDGVLELPRPAPHALWISPSPAIQGGSTREGELKTCLIKKTLLFGVFSYPFLAEPPCKTVTGLASLAQSEPWPVLRRQRGRQLAPDRRRLPRQPRRRRRHRAGRGRTARAGNPHFLPLSALCAHAQSTYRSDLLWKTLRALNRPGRARTATRRGRGACGCPRPLGLRARVQQ
jgi:hypothetical protein